MANSTAGRPRGRATAITASLIAHLLLLGALATSRPSLTEHDSSQPAISVAIIRAEPPEPRAREQMPPPNQSPPVAVGPIVATSPSVPPARFVETPTQPSQPTPPISQSMWPSDERLGAALRGSLVGCANIGESSLTPEERQLCHDSYALKDRGGPAFGVDPKALAVFDANARRANFLSQPFLSEKPKNGCRPIFTHKDYYVPGTGKEDMTVSMACGKSF